MQEIAGRHGRGLTAVRGFEGGWLISQMAPERSLKIGLMGHRKMIGVLSCSCDVVLV